MAEVLPRRPATPGDIAERDIDTDDEVRSLIAACSRTGHNSARLARKLYSKGAPPLWSAGDPTRNWHYGEQRCALGIRDVEGGGPRTWARVLTCPQAPMCGSL